MVERIVIFIPVSFDISFAKHSVASHSGNVSFLALLVVLSAAHAISIASQSLDVSLHGSVASKPGYGCHVPFLLRRFLFLIFLFISICVWRSICWQLSIFCKCGNAPFVAKRRTFQITGPGKSCYVSPRKSWPLIYGLDWQTRNLTKQSWFSKVLKNTVTLRSVN